MLPDFLKDYNLVWYDDFNGTSLDASKWNLKAEMREQCDLELREDDSAISIDNGILILTSDRIDESSYYTNTSVSSRGRMSFNYGYVEIRAKLPFGKPAWPSFWMLADTELNPTNTWQSEVDIFEVFGNDAKLSYNIHKWYRDGSGNHEQIVSRRKYDYDFNDKTEAEQWHTYGLLWTPQSFKFLVDGKVCEEMDITENGNFANDEYGMDGFHVPHYIIFNNYVYTKGFKGCETWAAGKEATSVDKFPIKYYIDYVKLYKKTGEGDLIIYNNQ